MVEHVAQPHQELRFLGQGQVDGGVERRLEVELAHVDPVTGVGEVGAAEVGVSESDDLHLSMVAQEG